MLTDDDKPIELPIVDPIAPNPIYIYILYIIYYISFEAHQILSNIGKLKRNSKRKF
jgi:hypothetical protein